MTLELQTILELQIIGNVDNLENVYDLENVDTKLHQAGLKKHLAH